MNYFHIEWKCYNIGSKFKNKSYMISNQITKSEIIFWIKILVEIYIFVLSDNEI